MEFLPEEELEDAHLLEALSQEPLGGCVWVLTVFGGILIRCLETLSIFWGFKWCVVVVSQYRLVYSLQRSGLSQQPLRKRFISIFGATALLIEMPQESFGAGQNKDSHVCKGMIAYQSFWQLWDKKVDSIGNTLEMRFVSWALALAWNIAMELVTWKSSWRFCWSNAFVSFSVVLKCQTQGKWTMAWDMNIFEAIGMMLKITWMRRNFLLLWMLDYPWGNIESIGKRLSFNCPQLDYD